MNLNNVYLPHFCRPWYHKKSLMDLIILLIAHFVLMITCSSGFVTLSTNVRNSLNPSNAQSKTNNKFNNHQTAVMPIKSATYELTVVHDSLTDLNQTRIKFDSDQTTKTNEQIKPPKLDQIDKVSQEQLSQLNQVKYSNQLNKVDIIPNNILNPINQQNQLNFEDSKDQINQFNVNDYQQQKNQQIIVDDSSIKQHNEMRDGFVVLTSAHNAKYPSPMHSRNVYAQSNSPNDFYQRYHTSTSSVTIRPIIKEYHQQINQENNEKINHKVNENSNVKLGVKDQNFLIDSAFLPEDNLEKDKEISASDNHKEIVNEFVDNLKNTNKDDGGRKSFYELYGKEMTAYNLIKNSTTQTAKPIVENSQTHRTSIHFESVNEFYNPSTIEMNPILNSNLVTSSSTNSPTFDLATEDSNYHPSMQNDENMINSLKAHGTRPGQILTPVKSTYELFKEYPLINNSNIIINQFHSNPNWTKLNESSSNRNQTKFFSENAINKNANLNPLPDQTEFFHPFFSNYSPFNPPSLNRTVVITEFANDFLTNLTSSSLIVNDLENSDSNRFTFFNFSTTTTTQSPIETLDKNQFDVPLSPQWNSIANQLTSTTLSPLPPILVSASELVTLKRNYSLPKFPYRPQFSSSTKSPSYLFQNNSLHLASSNVSPHFAMRLPNRTPSSILYSGTQSSSTSNNYINNSSTMASTFTSTSTSTPSTITPNVYKYVPPIATRQPPVTNFFDHNFTTYSNNHNFDESLHSHNPLRLATSPKVIQPLTLFLMSLLASKSSIGANLLTRNDQPGNSTAASNGGLIDWLRFSGRSNRKGNKSSPKRSNKQVSRQQKQRKTNNKPSNKSSTLSNLPISALTNLQIRPITLDELLINNQLNNQLASINSLAQQQATFSTPMNPMINPFLYSSTRTPQMIFETKRHRPSSNYIPEDLLSDEGFTTDDYEDEIKTLFGNQLGDLRLNSKLLNDDIKLSSNHKNSGSSSSSMYRTHRNSQSSSNSRNSRTPISDDNNSPSSHSLVENEFNGHSTNTPAPRCDKFTNDICVDDFEYPETAILEEIDRKKGIFQAMYSEVKGEVSQVDGLSRLQEQELAWEHEFGSNNYLNDSSNESSFSPSIGSPNRHSYSTMDDEMLNNEKTSYRFSSLVKDQGHSKTSGFICSSEILYGRPKLAKNVRGQWKVIVNAGQYTQTVRMEKCLQPNKACSFVQSNSIGASSRCAQVNAFHRLMVFEKGKGFYIDTFRIPSSCACYVQHKKTAISSSNEFDSDEFDNSHHKKINRKRTDNLSTIRDKTEIDRQTSNRLQNQGLSLPTSIFNQPFILNDLNTLQRSKLQTLFPTFGQRVSLSNNAHNLVNSKVHQNQQPSVELRPLYLNGKYGGGTLLASLLPLNDKNNNLNNTSLIEKLSITGTMNPSLIDHQQKELNQLILNLVKPNSNSPKTLAERSKIINLEDLIRTQLSLSQVAPNNLLDQLNTVLLSNNRLNDLSKTLNRRKNSSKNDLANALANLSTNNKVNNNNNNQKIGLLYYADNGSKNDKNSKSKLKTLPVVKLVQMPQLNNQLVYGQRFVDKRKSDIAQLLKSNKSNYTSILNNNNIFDGNLLNKTPLILPRDHALNLNLVTPISALKIITPENLITQSPVQQSSVNDSKDSKDSKEKSKDEDSSDENDDEEKIVDEIDVGNLLGNMEDQEDKEDGEVNYAEMNAESNHGESSEDHNTSSKNDHHSSDDHGNNELDEDDKENTTNEQPNDHEQPTANELDDTTKEHNLPSNHLEPNSSLFTFDNVVSSKNGPSRKLKQPNLMKNFDKLKLIDNSSFVSLSGFNDRTSNDFKNKFEETMHPNSFTTESNSIEKSKPYGSDEQPYSQLDPLEKENKNSQITKTTTSSYFIDSSNTWSRPSSTSTVFAPIRTLKRKNNLTSVTTISPSSYFSTTTNKRKQQNDLMVFGHKTLANKIANNLPNQITINEKTPFNTQYNRTADETNNQFIATSNSIEQTLANQSIDRLSIEEIENSFRNQTANNSINKSHRPINDRPISEILNSEKVNFNYHPILDFINRKE